MLALSAAAAAVPFAARADVAGIAPDSLNALASAKGLRFGSCLGTGPSGAPRQPGVTGQRANQFDDDQLMAFVAANGLLVRGHTLLWNRDIWMPPWTQSYDFGPRPATEAERLLTTHIHTVVSRYPQVFSWDVVNETIAPKTGEMEASVFTKAIGPQVIDIAFHAARAAAPHAQLVYNDYMSWGPGNQAHHDGVLRLLERLKKNNVPVDALGVQAHIGPGASVSA